MQKMYPRTNPAPFGASENSKIPAPQIEETLRESVRQNVTHMRHEPENATQLVPDVNSLVQRVGSVSMDQLDDVIVNLRQVRDSLHNVSERIHGEISDYLQLSQTAMGSSKIIAENIVLWKETAHGAARNLERGAATERTVVAPVPLTPPVPVLGIIPESEAALRASNLGTPVTICSSDSAPACAYAAAARRLAGESIEMTIPTDKRGFFNKLFGRRAA